MELQTPATTVFDPRDTSMPRTASATPSGQEQMIYLVPSRTPSDPARTSVGRAPISPVVARHSRYYHLPFSWRSASPLSLADDKEREREREREADGRPSRSTRSPSESPLSFLPTMTPSSTRTSPELHIHAHLHVFPKLMYGQPTSSTFLAELDGDGDGGPHEEHDVFWDEATGALFYDDDGVEDDIETVSGSMQWARPSLASDETKSPELAFARPSTASGPVMYTCASSLLLLPLSVTRPTHLCCVDPKRVDTAAGRNADMWRTLFFQTLLSAAQILGAVTSLADVAARRGAPSPFGTQHVALLLFAWAPTLAFGALPWHRLLSLIHVRFSQVYRSDLLMKICLCR